MEHYLLDCTLRDGGYINDWKFGRDNIANIFERQVSSGVDAIEVGFLDERREFDPDRTIQPDTACYDKIFGRMDHGNALVVAMIDFGTCGIEHLSPCVESCLDGIRVIFKKEKMHAAIAFCKQVKALGYKVFSQAVSITSYNDDELRELVGLVNDCHPYAMSMVDTYGLLDNAMLSHIISVIDPCLDRDIILGFHAHNNFQLGYSNAVTMLNSVIQRDVLVDGSLYGMGKSAGNAPIELIAMYMNAHFGKQYDVDQMQEAIVTSLLDIYKVEPWGYKLFYYIAAANSCHPNYVSYLMNKRTLSITAINEILQRIPEEEKLGKNMKMLEQLYLDYQSQACNDAEALRQIAALLEGRDVLMLGPGTTMESERDAIQAYIEQNHPFVISINYIPRDFKIDAMFISNAQRYRQMASRLLDKCYDGLPIIATSNVTRTGGKFPYVVNYSSLIDAEAEFPDNSMVMLCKLLCSVGVKAVSLAGFDGYTPDTMNYFNTNMEYSFVKEKADSLNQYGKAFFKSLQGKMDVHFVTKTQYQEASQA